jgi:hypothetical protein
MPQKPGREWVRPPQSSWSSSAAISLRSASAPSSSAGCMSHADDSSTCTPRSDCPTASSITWKEKNKAERIHLSSFSRFKIQGPVWVNLQHVRLPEHVKEKGMPRRHERSRLITFRINTQVLVRIQLPLTIPARMTCSRSPATARSRHKPADTTHA